MLKIYGHPFAAFYWKVAIAAYERAVPFELLMLDADYPEHLEAVARLGPAGQFPILVDGARTVLQSAAIIEYLDFFHGDAPTMVPADPRAAIAARQMDALFDDYLMGPLQRLVFNALRPESERDARTVAESKTALDRAYAWFERHMTGKTWACLETFTIADCAAAPALFYAHWGHPIPREYGALHAYRARLLSRPSIARVIDEARPWRENFPLKDHSPDA